MTEFAIYKRIWLSINSTNMYDSWKPSIGQENEVASVSYTHLTLPTKRIV